MAEGNVIIAKFAGTVRTAADGLWQWDYGQILQIEGLDLPAVTEIHFAQAGKAKTVLGETTASVCRVAIPNAMLQSADQIKAYIYLHQGEDDGETEYQIILPVRARAQPETYDSEDPTIQEEYDALVQAEDLLNNALSGISGSVAAAESARNDAERYKNDAKGYKDTASEKASEAAQYCQDAQGARGDAIDAKNAAVQAKNAAVQAKNAAERAQEKAEAAALDAEAYTSGTRNGVPVGPSDPAYENNGAYYLERLNLRPLYPSNGSE